MSMYFSSVTGGFYPSEKRSSYESAGTWPDDAVQMTESEMQTFYGADAPSGMRLGGDASGRPAWVDLPAPTNAEIQARFERDIQARLDGFARTRNYDSMLSACTYATSSVAKFAAEGQYCVELRDDTWSAAYTILADALAGTRPIPTSIADIESDLPVMAWPA